jgi:hypothetical protein
LNLDRIPAPGNHDRSSMRCAASKRCRAVVRIRVPLNVNTTAILAISGHQEGVNSAEKEYLTKLNNGSMTHARWRR